MRGRESIRGEKIAEIVGFCEFSLLKSVAMFTDTARRVIAGGGWSIAVFASVLFLAACGGGGGAGVLPQTPERATQPQLQTPQNVAFGVALRGGEEAAGRTSFKAVRDAHGNYVVQPMTAAVPVVYSYTIIYLTVTVREPITVRNPDAPVITLEGGRIVPEDEAPTEAPVDETPAPPQDETPPSEPPAQDPPQTPVNNDPPDEGTNPPPDSTPPDEGGAQLPVSPPVNNDPPDEGGNPPQTPVNNDPPDEGGNPPEDNTPPDEGVTPQPVEPPPPPPPPPPPVIPPVNVDPPPPRAVIHPGIPSYQNKGGGLSAIKADAAHSAGYFGQGVTVAVFDAKFHSGLESAWTTELHFADTPSVRRFNSNSHIQIRAAHLIGAAHNTVGIDGVAPSVKIMPLLRLSRKGDGGERVTLTRTVSFPGGFNWTVTQNWRYTSFYHDAADTALQEGPFGWLSDYPYYSNGAGPYGAGGGWWETSLDRPFAYAISNGANIIHNAYQAHINVRGKLTVNGVRHNVMYRAPIMPEIPNSRGYASTQISVINDVMRGKDVVAVWDAGDNGWHEGGYVKMRGASEYLGNFARSEDVVTQWVTPAYIMSNVINPEHPSAGRGYGGGITVTSANAVSYMGWGPYYEPELLGKWLVAVAVDQNNNNTIASFSNGCGNARAWCLAAPGVNVFSTSMLESPRWYGAPRHHGTPYAAAYVAGALALLRGRYPDMPMSVVAQILLSTATDLGAAGVDGVYGHGMVNVSAAMAAQAGARYVSPDAGRGSFGAGGLPMERGKTQIPNALAGLGSQLREVKMAVRYLNDRYYDASPDVDIAPRPELSAMRVVDDLWNETSDGGNAGAARFFVRKNDGDQLREAGGELGGFQVRHNWFGDAPLWSDVESSDRPFFFSSSGGKKSEVSWRMGNAGFFASRGEEKTGDYNQYGVRLWQRAGRLHLSSALSEIREEDSLLGGRFGGVLPLAAGGETRQGKVLAKFAMDGFGASDEWHVFGSYQHARTEAKLGGVVSALSGLRARGWQAGLSGRGVFRGGDVFRFAVGEETALSGGKAILRYARSSGAEVDEATQIRVNRGIRIEEREVEIKNNTRPSLSAAYGFRPTEKSRLSFGITHTPGATSQAGINYRVDF